MGKPQKQIPIYNLLWLNDSHLRLYSEPLRGVRVKVLIHVSVISRDSPSRFASLIWARARQ